MEVYFLLTHQPWIGGMCMFWDRSRFRWHRGMQCLWKGIGQSCKFLARPLVGIKACRVLFWTTVLRVLEHCYLPLFSLMAQLEVGWSHSLSLTEVCKGPSLQSHFRRGKQNGSVWCHFSVLNGSKGEGPPSSYATASVAWQSLGRQPCPHRLLYFKCPEIQVCCNKWIEGI